MKRDAPPFEKNTNDFFIYFRKKGILSGNMPRYFQKKKESGRKILYFVSADAASYATSCAHI